MKDILILRLKLFISYLLCKKQLEINKMTTKNIFVFLGADYGNLGDVAITYAQTKYLKEMYPEYNIVEIPISQTYAGIKSVKRLINKEDIITLVGGGNSSDMYDDIEFLRQLVIWNFRKYSIIGFPQTFDFSNSLKGHICKSIAVWVYSRAKYYTILAREANTIKILQKDFYNINSIMMPDIVMTLDERIISQRRGVLICLRSDKEKSTSLVYQKEIEEKAIKKYKYVTFQDTQIFDVNKNNRYIKLKELIRIFQSNELVITDRLHGMILAFITGTPALVFDNSNNKISGCFEWIKDCGYIKMIENINDVEDFRPYNNFDCVHNKILNQYKEIQCLKFL